jgi:hypothetical protein
MQEGYFAFTWALMSADFVASQFCSRSSMEVFGALSFWQQMAGLHYYYRDHLEF